MKSTEEIGGASSREYSVTLNELSASENWVFTPTEIQSHLLEPFIPVGNWACTGADRPIIMPESHHPMARNEAVIANEQ